MDIFESGNFKDIAQIVKEKPEGYRRQRHAEYHGNGGLEDKVIQSPTLI